MTNTVSKLNALKKKQTTHNTSLCWDCCHSAAPVEMQCSWDRHLKMPEGAERAIFIDEYANGRRGGLSKSIIISCPEFMDMNDEENLKLRKEAQKRASDKKMEDYIKERLL